MQYSLAWTSNDSLFFCGIITAAISFVLYYFLSESHKINENLSAKFGKQKSLAYSIYFQRLLGVLFFGIVPAIVILIVSEKSISFYGINFSNFGTSLYWVLGLSPLIVLMNFFNSKKSDNLSLYPQIRKSIWGYNTLIMSAITWAVYLLAYEFMFRGVLLFISLQYLGVWASIALNVAIYSLVHVPKGIKEAVGALPLGIVLGIITVQTSSIFVAFFVHVVLALSNEWFSLKAHPNIKIKRLKT